MEAAEGAKRARTLSCKAAQAATTGAAPKKVGARAFRAGVQKSSCTAARLHLVRGGAHSSVQARASTKPTHGSAGAAEPPAAGSLMANVISGVTHLFSGNKAGAAPPTSPVVLDGAHEAVCTQRARTRRRAVQYGARLA